MGYLTRKPTSNEPERDGEDWFFLLISGLAKRCAKCRNPARNENLKDGVCPACREAPAKEETHGG